VIIRDRLLLLISAGLVVTAAEALLALQGQHGVSWAPKGQPVGPGPPVPAAAIGLGGQPTSTAS
jgi:hypothetical protein